MNNSELSANTLVRGRTRRAANLHYQPYWDNSQNERLQYKAQSQDGCRDGGVMTLNV